MKRDEYNIIIQPNGVEIDGVAYDDGGDSAFSTGLSAFGGSEQDFQLMPSFIKDEKLVRHPYQTINTGDAPHNDPAATSRDAVLAFFAGMVGRWDLLIGSACHNYAKSWRVNRDYLSPADKLYLYKCVDIKAPLWLAIIGRIWMAGEILVSCWINPKHEANQISVKASVFGRWWLWTLEKLHPDLYGNIREYFSGWRKRAPIGEGMINRFSNQLKGGA